MDVNVMAATNPREPKAKLLQQSLQVPECNIAATALDGFQRPFWARHGNPPF
jgi:hypothetical protein